MELLGYTSAIVIGLSLGLIGGGGSILTVPVLVYLLAVEPVAATAYSLFVVGATSLVGAVPKYRRGLVDLRTALVFGAPSIVAVFAVRSFLVPAIPPVLFTVAGTEVTKGTAMLVLFAMMMVAASVSMIRTPKTRTTGPEANAPRKFNYPVILAEGLAVGAITGLVGAGGGFLIIPALVVLSKLPMKQAVGTSLLIIAAKSLIGFIGDLQRGGIDWPLLLAVTALAVVGIFIGNALSNRIDGNRLKVGFGWFVLVMGVVMLVKETLAAGGGADGH